MLGCQLHVGAPATEYIEDMIVDLPRTSTFEFTFQQVDDPVAVIHGTLVPEQIEIQQTFRVPEQFGDDQLPAIGQAYFQGCGDGKDISHE